MGISSQQNNIRDRNKAMLIIVTILFLASSGWNLHRIAENKEEYILPDIRYVSSSDSLTFIDATTDKKITKRIWQLNNLPPEVFAGSDLKGRKFIIKPVPQGRNVVFLRLLKDGSAVFDTVMPFEFMHVERLPDTTALIVSDSIPIGRARLEPARATAVEREVDRNSRTLLSFLRACCRGNYSYQQEHDILRGIFNNDRNVQTCCYVNQNLIRCNNFFDLANEIRTNRLNNRIDSILAVRWNNNPRQLNVIARWRLD
jgi:hypothetical protein